MKRSLTAALLLPGTLALFMVWGCPADMPPATQCSAAGEACTNRDGCCDGLACTAGVCTEPPPANVAAIPAKTIGFDLIGIHDPDSAGYNGNCIGCHGDRSEEVALDGVTPSAHATMASLFGSGNARCLSCHGSGPNFLTRSAAALVEQVEISSCAQCHGASAVIAFYAE
jgi:hypothetical protein